ncbi:MAG: RbsD or FucU transport [Candidatus Hydrogenedentes bacterium]|nr:RbsD or FucU transport [Candidatus Hydrogenedentota bacterium]
MLKQRLIHPEIIEALAAAGHGARVLITDGNYPGSTQLGENAQLIYLNLEPGVPTVTQVLSVLLSAIPIEDAAVMEPDTGEEPPVFAEFRQHLDGLELTRYSRFEFYEEASGPETCVQIVTGEQRIYANLLLTIGVVFPENVR